MIRKKDLLEMREKLVLLRKDLRILHEYYKPKRKLFFFYKGDLAMASIMINNCVSLGNQIKLIDYFLGDKDSLNYPNYNYACLREATDEWLRDVPKSEINKIKINHLRGRKK